MKNRILCLFLAVCILLAIPVPAKAAAVASGTIGKLQWVLDDAGCLTLTGSGAMKDFDYQETPWFPYSEQIYSVVIGEGITSVGECAFGNLPLLTSVVLPEGITSIGEEAFRHCDRLSDITLPSTLEIIHDDAFEYCYCITGFDFPEGLKSIGGSAFMMCGSLEEVVLPASLTYLGSSCFSQCDDLKRVVISDGITELLSSTFFSCDALREVVLPANLTLVENSVFGDCVSLEEFTVPSTVQSFDSSALAGNSAMTSIEVEEGNTAVKSVDGVLFSADGKTLLTFPAGRGGVYAIPDGTETVARMAFNSAEKLTAISFPESVKTIDPSSFYYCYGLTEVVLPGVESVGKNAFLACTGLKTVVFGDGISYLDYGVFHNYPSAAVEQIYFTGSAPTIDEGALRYITATAYYPSGDSSWESVICESYGGTITWVAYDPDAAVAEGSFGDGFHWSLDAEGLLTVTGSGAMPDLEASAWKDVRNKVKKAVICDGITHIGSNAFYGCCNMTEVSIPGSVTSIGDQAFQSCANLSAVTLSENLHSIGAYAFSDSGLKEIVMPDSCQVLGTGAFYACMGLTDVTLSSSLKAIPTDCFADCDSLTELTVPDSVIAIGETALYDSDALVSVTLSKALESYEGGALSDCDSLQNIYISEDNASFTSLDGVLYSKDLTVLYNYPAGRSGSYTVAEGTEKIAYAAFLGSAKLTNVRLPDSLVEIGEYAFMDCVVLPEVVLGDRVTTVSDFSFYGCNKLIRVVLGKSVATVGDRFIYYTNHDRTLKQIYFHGSMPVFHEKALYFLYGDVYYPASDTSWSEAGADSYGSLGILWHAHTHSYTETVTEATCTEPGVKGQVCECGDRNVEQIPALGHCYGEWNSTEAATCTEEGIQSRECARCGDIQTETVPALGHTEVTDAGQEPTCTADGLTEGKRCSLCGTVLVAQESIPAKGHSWDEGKVTAEPTEETEGVRTYTCTACGETKTENIPALEHTHKYTEAVTAPTCTEPGFTTYTCACGDSYTADEVPALGHDTVTDEAKTPTCTEEGLTQGSHCGRCGIVLEEQKTIPVREHSWDEGKVTTEPTEETEGVRTYTCTACGETKTENIPALEHTHKYTEAVTAPTCTEPGFTTYTCSCGESYKDLFTDAVGHTFGQWTISQEPKNGQNGIKSRACHCGQKETGEFGNPFTDVAVGKYYSKAVFWAYENGITKGTTSTEFSLKKDCTRKQIVMFLWRTAGQPDPQNMESPFEDVRINNSFAKAILWAVEQGITTGTGDGSAFSPDAPCTRKQIAMFLWRAAGKPAVDISESPFEDVSIYNSFAEAILWAYQQDITTGTGDGTTFSPNDTCTRGQIVTFLYRNLVREET